MLPDRVSNPGPLTYESDALPIALRGPASPTCGHVTKLYVELEFQNKGNKQTKKKGFLSKVLWFSRQDWI